MPKDALDHVQIDVLLTQQGCLRCAGHHGADLPAITEANHVTGAFDHQLRADLPDAASLDRLVRELKRRAGVAATSTRVILRTTLPRR